MENGRIKCGMWVIDVLDVMSGGDADVLDVCIKLWEYGEKLDPNNFYCGFSLMLILDSLGIYDAEIFKLWDDVCEKDVGKIAIILIAYQLGLISREKLSYAINHGGKGVDLNVLARIVKCRLPHLNLSKLEV